MRRELVAHAEIIGFALATLAILAAWTRRLTAPTQRTLAYDRLWFDFRDTFGLFWALRVQERVNAAAQQYDWPLELTWTGFRDTADQSPLAAIDPAIEPALRTTLKGLLRRFVTNQWIAQRRSEGLD